MNTSYASINDRISDITKELEALTLVAHQINLQQQPMKRHVSQTFNQVVTEILEAKQKATFQQTSYDELMSKLTGKFPEKNRANIQVQLSLAVNAGYVERNYIGLTKFYTIGEKGKSVRINKFSYPRHDGVDYAKGGTSGIKNQLPKILSFINALEKPHTSKQAFNLFVHMFPKMEGCKQTFDSNLSTLANKGAIGRTKNSMSDDNSSVQSKYHWGSVELINSVK